MPHFTAPRDRIAASVDPAPRAPLAAESCAVPADAPPEHATATNAVISTIEERLPLGITETLLAHAGKPPLEIGDEVVWILQADVQANQRAVVRPTRCGAIGARIHRNREALEAAEARAHPEQLERVQH